MRGGSTSDPRILRNARRLRRVTIVLEALLGSAIAGSALAMGAVHAWAYVPLWAAGALAVALLAVRAALVRRLRVQLGPNRFALPIGGRWVVVNPVRQGEGLFELDLGRGAWPRPALLWPGAGMLVLAALQVLPLPEALAHALAPARHHLGPGEAGGMHSLSLDARATLRGMAFLTTFLSFHVCAAAVAGDPAARRRFRSGVAWLGGALALVALVQAAAGARRILGVFTPLESETFLGTFVNRNHFAAYMALCTLAGLSVLSRALGGFRRRAGSRVNLRRRLVTLGAPEGVRLILAAVPVVLTASVLLASVSRGALLSFLGASAVAWAASRRQERPVPAGALVFVLLVMPLAWFGVDRLQERFSQVRSDEVGRTAVWKLSLRVLRENWLTGSGFNTFRPAVGRTLPLGLPEGAPPWPEEVASAQRAAVRLAERVPAELRSSQWFREAHNDYLQVAVETGLPGVLVLIWGLVSLARRLRDPWLSGAVAGLLIHSFLDFSLQIPAVAILFAAVSAHAAHAAPAAHARNPGR